MGRSKVVRKFLYRNFLPPEVQKGRYPCAASRPRCADTCSPFLSICRANAISCALPREMLKNADYTTFSTDRNRPAFAGRFFMSVERYPVGCDDSAHRCLPPARIIPQGRTLFARAREMDANKQHLPAEGNGAPSRTPGHLLLRRCRNSPCRALRRCLLFHSARLRVIINIDGKGGAAGA